MKKPVTGFQRERRRAKQRAKAIREEYSERVAKAGGRRAPPRTESPIDWLKREAYAFVRDILDRGRVDILYNDEANGRSVPAEANPFYQGLKSIFKAGGMERGEYHRMGRQLLYAYEHNVPNRFVVAFIRWAAAPQKIQAKLADAGHTEIGFRRLPWKSRVSAARRKAKARSTDPKAAVAIP